MGVIELFILAVGLSMDAFAVSVCKGLAMKKAPAKAMVVCGAWFGGFQALIPDRLLSRHAVHRCDLRH